MISDVLCEAIESVRKYLDDHPEVYATARKALHRWLDVTEAIQASLDVPPTTKGENYPLVASTIQAVQDLDTDKVRDWRDQLYKWWRENQPREWGIYPIRRSRNR